MFINNFDPVALSFFSLEVRWYSLAYIFGIIFGWIYCKKLINDKKLNYLFDNYVTYLIVGIILGGRLGYVIFYNLDFYIRNPLEIFMIWTGGMSFHGALIGIIISSYFFSKKNKQQIFFFLDLVAISSPIGIFFGRIANFMNSELYGIETNVPWAVKFIKVDNLYRHPTQLYEAFFEGIILFIILLYFRNKDLLKTPGIISSLFLIFYSIFRFVIEFFRAPDNQLGYLILNLTMGQIASLIFLLIGILIISNYANKKES
mgnify:CR=1 FL=1